MATAMEEWANLMNRVGEWAMRVEFIAVGGILALAPALRVAGYSPEEVEATTQAILNNEIIPVYYHSEASDIIDTPYWMIEKPYADPPQFWNLENWQKELASQANG